MQDGGRSFIGGPDEENRAGRPNGDGRPVGRQPGPNGNPPRNGTGRNGVPISRDPHGHGSGFRNNGHNRGPNGPTNGHNGANNGAVNGNNGTTGPEDRSRFGRRAFDTGSFENTAFDRPPVPNPYGNAPSSAFENTAYTEGPIGGPEASRLGPGLRGDDALFEQFENDYRTGYPVDRELDRELDRDYERDFGEDPEEEEPEPRGRHGRDSARREGVSRIPLFSRKHKDPAPPSPARPQRASAPARRPAENPLADIQGYLVPILVAVAIVMVLVVILLNR